ncbi:MAG TPA: PaaI family thioesterase [Burkholderiaceae bacterium]|nr:PaaI family thioesterase [Burkholderiaceae bacterium]
MQDSLKVHCFGCGSLNERGLQIKSHWDGDELVCRWSPKPYHIGHPGVVYGGLIASVVDCHAIWTAMATACRDEGVPLDDANPPPFAFVTGKLSVSYLNPARVDRPLELRAKVSDRSERRIHVGCRVMQDGTECAGAEVVAVRVPSLGVNS